MKQILSFFTTLFMASMLYAQTDAIDSCAIAPLYTASIDGIDKKGMLSVDDLSKVKKLVASEKDITILRFTFSIDCDACDLYIGDVNSDTFPGDELKHIHDMKPMQVLSFECIVGKNKKGELVTCKPFLFYIKP